MPTIPQEHQQLTGKDYYYRLAFTTRTFKGLDTFLPSTGNWTLSEDEDGAHFTSPDCSFSCQAMTSSYRFDFGKDITALSALRVMEEVCRNFLDHHQQKYALYFVLVESDAAVLLY